MRGGGQALCPVTRSVEFLTDIAIALDSTEQRFKKRPPLTRFTLPYTRVSFTETAAFQAFFESQKGAYDSTWSFTLGATTYTHLAFEDDTFTVTEDAATPKLYGFTLRARQTQNTSPIGPQYVYNWQDGSGSRPSGSLAGWELQYPILTDADLAIREGHFRNNWGKWGGPWSFTDDDNASVHPKCRYDSDSIAIVNNGPNQNSLTLRILETN